MDVAVRAATLTDIGELARLRWQLYTEREPHDEPLGTYVERFATFALDALARDDWRAWCAELDGRLVAAAWLHTVPRVPAPGHGDPRPIGYLTNVYVEPEHRSKRPRLEDDTGAHQSLPGKRFRTGRDVPGRGCLRLLRPQRIHSSS